MKSYVVSALLFVLCNTFGTAQGMKQRPTPMQRVMLFQRNSALIEKLVDNGVKLTRQADPLSRSENFTATFLELEQQILRALSTGDRNRLHELNEHMKSLAGRALFPSVGAAREQISQNNPAEKRLFDVRDGIIRILSSIDTAVTTSDLANSTEAIALKESLSQALRDLDQRMEVKPK